MKTIHAIESEHDSHFDPEALVSDDEPLFGIRRLPVEDLPVKDLSVRLFEECRGNPVAQLRVEQNGETIQRHRLHRPFVVVGSDPRCDVCLEDENDEIKPQHLMLQWIDGSLFCCDLSQITASNSEKKSSTIGRWLDHQPIDVGCYRLSLENFPAHEPPGSSPLERQFDRDAKLPEIGLRFIGVSQSDNVWKFDRTLVLVGKSPQCKLRLNHHTIAPTQAWLLRTPHGVWLVDLVGSESTRVNDQVVQFAPIDIGDRVQFGQFRTEVISTEFLFNAPPVNESLPRNQIAESSNPYDKPLPPIRFDRPLEGEKASSPLSEPLKKLTIPLPSDLLRNTTPIENSILFPSEDAPIAAVLAKVPTLTSIPVPATVPELVTSIEEDEAQAEPIPVAVEQPFAEMPSLPSLEMMESADAKCHEVPAMHVETIAPACELVSPNMEMTGFGVAASLPIVGVRIQPSLPATPRLQSYKSIDTAMIVGEDLEAPVAANIEQICPTYRPFDETSVPTDAASTPVPTDSTPLSSNGRVTPTSIQEFIEAQRAEIAQLRSCLNEFQLAYESAAGTLISRKVRDSLERPVLATTGCCDSLIRNLDRFVAEQQKPTE